MNDKKKSLLKYADNVASPVIKQDGVKAWQTDSLKSVNRHFSQKFEEIKKEYSSLIDEFKWNELIYKSRHSFKPLQGKVYHLYQKNDNDKDLFLSIVDPSEWNMLFIGSFKLLSNNKWEKIEDE